MTKNSDLMQKELAHIVKKFPEFELKIIHLYACDVDFKTLCDDYCYCSCIVGQPAVKNASERDLQVKEYRGICVALEKEALAYLQRH